MRMKSLYCMLVLLLAFAGVACGQIVVAQDDFEGGTLGGDGSTDGWYAVVGTIDLLTYIDHPYIGGLGQSLSVNPVQVQAKKTIAPGIVDADEDLYFRWIVTPGNQPIFAGTFGGTRPAFQLFVQPGGDIKLTAANNGPTTVSSGEYTIQNNRTYELILQMKNIIIGGGKGSVSIRDISAGETAMTPLPSLQDIPMNFMQTAGFAKPAVISDFWVRGQYNGRFDLLELGIGVAEPVAGFVREDFEDATLGNTLADEGWTALYGTDITKTAITEAAIPGLGQSMRYVFGADSQAAKPFSGNLISDQCEDLYLSVYIRPSEENLAIRTGVFGDVRPGVYVALTPNTDTVTLTPANFGASVSSTEYPIDINRTYHVLVQIKNISHGNTGSVFIRDVKAGDRAFTPISALQNVPMNFSNTTDFTKPSNFSQFYLRGNMNGQVDNIEIGLGMYPELTNMMAYEDFSHAIKGRDLSESGWVQVGNDITNTEVVDHPTVGLDLCMRFITSYAQATKQITTNEISDEIEDLYMSAYIRVGNQPIFAGMFGDVRPGGYISLTPSSDTVTLTPANPGAGPHPSTTEYPIDDNTTYQVLLQIKNINHGNSASVFIRNVDEFEDEFTALVNLQNVPMNFVHATDFTRPSNFSRFYVRGGFNGWVDSIELGVGSLPEIDPLAGLFAQSVSLIEDFESATLGNTLADEGWEVLYSGNPNTWGIVDDGDLAAAPLTGEEAQWVKDFYSDPNLVVAEDSDLFVYVQADITAEISGGKVQPVRAGVFSTSPSDGGRRAGLFFGFVTDGTTDTLPRLYFHNSLSAAAGTPDMEWESDDQVIFAANRTYRIMVQVWRPADGAVVHSVGSVYYKDLTAGDKCFTPVPNMQGLPMKFNDTLSTPNDWREWYIRGGYNAGIIDNLEVGTGEVSLCEAGYCDPSQTGLLADFNGDCVVNDADLTILAGSWLNVAPANLLVNGDFSQVDADGLPVGWTFYDQWEDADDDPTTVNYVQVESNELHQMMEKGIPQGRGAGVYQAVPAIPGAEYAVNGTWRGTVDDNGWAEIYVVSVNDATDPNNVMTTLNPVDGGIVAKHDGFTDPAAVFGPEPITDAMYHVHCDGSNSRVATDDYIVVLTKLGSIAPDSGAGLHEMYIDDVTLTGRVPGDADGDGRVDLDDFAQLVQEWMEQVLGPYN